jgi:hypothetical protein
MKKLYGLIVCNARQEQFFLEVFAACIQNFVKQIDLFDLCCHLSRPNLRRESVRVLCDCLGISGLFFSIPVEKVLVVKS